MPSLITLLRHLKAGGIPAAKRLLKEENHNHVQVISTNPPVIYLIWGRDDSILHRSLQARRLVLLYAFFWAIDPSSVAQIASEVKQRLVQFPKHRIILLCNEETEVKIFQSLGVEAEFINHNAFVNEDICRPLPVRKSHDAVYCASLAPYKRLELAQQINSLIILAYNYGGTTSIEYETLARAALSHAWWAVDARSDKDKASLQTMVQYYNRAKVGICLSASEGAMFASMEYMLCGLPIVSTLSRGGRDVFFDNEYVLIADDNPSSISQAVSQLASKEISPEMVRSGSLAKIREHRERFTTLLRTENVECSLPWLPGSHGVVSWTNLKALSKQLS